MVKEGPSILLTEYFVSIFNPYTCEPTFLAEACGMLFSLIKILKKANTDITVTVSRYLVNIIKTVGKDVNIEITSRERYFEQLYSLKDQVDLVIAVAPPVQLVTIAEIVKHRLLGPQPTMVKALSSKFEALNILKKYGVNVPNTIMCCDDENQCDLSDLTPPLVVKPSMLAGSECVYIVNNIDIVKEYVEKVIGCDPEQCAVVQEYIPGYHGSISTLLLYGKPLALSLNLQLISIKNNVVKYHGNILPLRNKIFVQKALDIIDKLKYLKDLNGYIGLDVVWNNDMYVVEVNPRFTTSGIGIAELYPDLGEVILGRIIPRNVYLGYEVKEYAYIVKSITLQNNDFNNLCLKGLVLGYTKTLSRALEIVKKVNPYALINLPYNIDSIDE